MTNDTMIDRETFERDYAKRSGVSVEQLYQMGRRAIPCRCGSLHCDDWQMVSRETAESEVALGRIPAIWLERWS